MEQFRRNSLGTVPRKGKENNSFIHSINIYWEPARCQFFTLMGAFR